jgi:CRP/FNR family transcriptional regulator
MLRITIDKDKDAVVLRLEGQLIGPWVEDVEQCWRKVNFVPREPLLDLLQRYGEAGLRSAQALSREFQSAYRDIHDLILAHSSAGKLAKLLLSWTPTSANTTKEIRVRSGLTHEEMAQMIGASRETVTRLLVISGRSS